MLTDWMLMRRLAAELDVALRSGRVREAGLTGDGRLGLRVRARGAGGDTLLIDAFALTPLVTLENAPILSPALGWPRAIADALLGMRLERVATRRGDRLVAFDFATRSRFGVLRGYRLVAELVPRYGNVLLLQDNVVVVAAKEFRGDAKARRAIAVGATYQLPPLAEPVAGAREAFEAAIATLADVEPSEADATTAAKRAASKTLRGVMPLVPITVAESLVAEIADELQPLRRSAAGVRPSEVAQNLLMRAERLLERFELPDDRLSEVYVYRENGKLVGVHVVPLHQFVDASLERAALLAPILEELGEGSRERESGRTIDARRAALDGRVRRIEERTAKDVAITQRERAEAGSAAEFRRNGDLLYAHLHEVAPGASAFTPSTAPDVTMALDPELDAKGNAAAFFRLYRKAVSRSEHAERRLTEFNARLEMLVDLRWQIERAGPAELAELTDEVDALERKQGPKRAQAKRRPAIEFPLSADSRVLVGRTPRGNAELTFRVARPDDLWFHARGIPGAHVVLRIDSRREPTDSEVQSAASLAAFHSKASGSAVVAVDYAPRKHVRKQRDALPGLVWYTHAQTVEVAPQATPPSSQII